MSRQNASASTRTIVTGTYIGVVLVQVVTTVALLWLERVYAR